MSTKFDMFRFRRLRDVKSCKYIGKNGRYGFRTIRNDLPECTIPKIYMLNEFSFST